MCKCLVNVQMLSECANAWLMCKCENVQMCKWSLSLAGLLLINLIMCNFVC